MSQQQQITNFEIQEKQQLVYALTRDIARNEVDNARLEFKIEILQDEIRELKKDGVFEV